MSTHFPLCLNELSCEHDQIEATQRVASVIAFIEVLRNIKNKLPELSLVSESGDLNFKMGANWSTLRSIIGGDYYKDQWHFLKNLALNTPRSVVDVSGSVALHYRGTYALGCSLAHCIGSSVISFVTPNPDWKNKEIPVDDGLKTITVKVKNFSDSKHIIEWADFLEHYSSTQSGSSQFCSTDGLSIRMYPYDHWPAHYHLYFGNGDKAAVNIETGEVCAGRIPSGQRANLIRFNEEKKELLMDNWALCQKGKHPNGIVF